MPFTLAHPVAVLPFARCRRCHFPALVIGSLSPDFVYFLHGRAVAGGHGLADMLWPNLALCLAFYWLYLALWRSTLRDFLPNCLNAEMRLPENEQSEFRQNERSEFLRSKNEHSKFRLNGQDGRRFGFKPTGARAVAFVLSALFGMATHLLLDAFTHPAGWFVQHLAPLRQPMCSLPLFKWLQYGGGLFGVAACLLFVCCAARRRPCVPAKSAAQKGGFWAACAGLSLLGFAAWQAVAPVPLTHAATQVIRLIDCAVLAFSALCLLRLGVGKAT
ncbi:DUF4184 family protein [Eikenella sp. S3360]|uniref:DUF4184 family protein n=2 Tax=Eikenella glucosivorans TaxID=2766967 RepID=A0ABS0N7G7_9NEIS|nr:DUF4184 family protein [Eikenella glucosivorans]